MHKTKMTAALAFGVVTAAGVGSTFASPVSLEVGPNLVTNSGFENSSGIASSGWTVSGFLAEGFDYFIDTALADAHSGNHSFAGGGVGAPGFISQNLATTAGANYDIHLWLANLSGFRSGTEIDIYWGGNLVYSAADITGISYREIVIDPLATTSSTALSIGLRDDGFFLNVDDVSVRQVAQQVPEPISLALVGLSLAGLCLMRPKPKQ